MPSAPRLSLSLDREHPNVRVALDWAVGVRRGGGPRLDLASAARTFWDVRGHVDEGGRRLEAALALEGAESTARIRGLYAAGVLHALALRYEKAEDLQREVVELCRGLGDEHGLARALNALGIALYHLERVDEAEWALTESLDLKRRLGDERGAAFALLSLGKTAILADDLDAAERHQRNALAAFRVAGDELTIAGALDDLGMIRLFADDHEGAQILLEESLDVARRIGALSLVANVLAHLGLALRRSDPERARLALVEALTLFDALSEPEGIAATLQAFAASLLPGDTRRSAVLTERPTRSVLGSA